MLYTGKGGVGKTTTAAATAVLSAGRGTRTLVVSSDAAHSLGDVLGERIGNDPREIAPSLHACEIDARARLARHWGRISDYLVSLFRQQGIDGVVAEELALLPGAEELMSLIAVDELARSGDFDLIVVDCAPTDATLRLASLPEVATSTLRLALRLQRALASVVTPLAAAVTPVPLPDAAVFADMERLLYRTLRRLRARLCAKQTSVRMVVTPERLSIDEAKRAHTELALFGLRADLVVMNRLLPECAGIEPFFAERARVQEERHEQVVEAFAPVQVVRGLLQGDEVVGLPRLEGHGAQLFGDLDPAALHPHPPPVRIERTEQGYLATVPLPGVRGEGLDVLVVEDELLVRVEERRRAIKLPARVAACPLGSARLRDGELAVHFVAEAPSRAPRALD